MPPWIRTSFPPRPKCWEDCGCKTSKRYSLPRAGSAIHRQLFASGSSGPSRVFVTSGEHAMETIELRQAERRAYELGRVRLGAKLAVASLVVGAAAVGLGRPVGITAALSVVLAALVGLIAFRGGSAGRALWPALAAGTAAMFFPLAIRTAGCSLFG